MALVAFVCLAAVGSVVRDNAAGRTIVAGPARLVMAGDLKAAGGRLKAEPSALGRCSLVPAGKESVVARDQVPAGLPCLWVRMRGSGIGVRVADGPVRWLWPHRAQFGWVWMGRLEPAGAQVELVAPSDWQTLAVDCAVWVAGPDQQPLSVGRETTVLRVAFRQPKAAISPFLASANVPSPASVFVRPPAQVTDAVKALRIRAVRFQGVGAGWDVRRPETWRRERLKEVANALSAAKRMGVEVVILCFNGLKVPRNQAGGLATEKFDQYARACAAIVRHLRQAARVRLLCEPFNELDHPALLKKLRASGQDFSTVAELYSRCAKAIVAAAGDVQVGGPALCWPSSWAARQFVKNARAPLHFLSWHHYATGKASTPTAELMKAVRPVGSFWQGVRAMEQAASALPHRPMLVLDEYHLNFQAWDPVDPRVAGSEAAAFAGALLSWLPRTSVDMAMIHDIISRHYGLVGLAGDDWLARSIGLVPAGLQPKDIFVRPAGWVIRWYNEFVRGRWCPCGAEKGAEDDHVLTLAWVAQRGRGVMLVNTSGQDTPVAVLGDQEIIRAPAKLNMICRTGPVEAVVPESAGVVRLTLPPWAVAFLRWPAGANPPETGAK